jgi:hypothetical protein
MASSKMMGLTYETNRFKAICSIESSFLFSSQLIYPKTSEKNQGMVDCND